MRRLEKLLWALRGEASEWVVEEYECRADPVMYPVLAWVLVGVIGYASVGFLATEGVPSASGVVVGLALGFVSVAAVWLALTVTLASKYYFTEWTADVRPPEVSR